MTTPDELLPCPFCGGDADIDHDYTVEECHGYGCLTCGVWFSEFLYGADAAAAWNRRAEVAALVAKARADALEEAAEAVKAQAPVWQGFQSMMIADALGDAAAAIRALAEKEPTDE